MLKEKGRIYFVAMSSGRKEIRRNTKEQNDIMRGFRETTFFKMDTDPLCSKRCVLAGCLLKENCRISQPKSYCHNCVRCCLSVSEKANSRQEGNLYRGKRCELSDTFSFKCRNLFQLVSKSDRK